MISVEKKALIDAEHCENGVWSGEWIEQVRSVNPLVECLTNTVTMNDVANCILAVGGSPVMGMASEEIREFVSLSRAVLLNVGTMTSGDLASFTTAMAAAAELKKPVVLDPVGVGAAGFRTRFVLELLDAYPCAVIRGNASEVAAVLTGTEKTMGVDAAPSDVINDATLEHHLEVAQKTALRYGCVVSMSGAMDVISNGKQTWVCRNGVPWMSRVTGTGCSLSGITAAFVGAVPREAIPEAVAMATAMMGCAGEVAFEQAKNQGLGSFRCALVDALSRMNDDELSSRRRLQRIK